MSRSGFASIHHLAKRVPPSIWEIGVGLLVTAIATGASHHFDLFEWFVAQGRAHERYQLDEFFILFVVATAMLAVFTVRRSRELKVALAGRQISEARFAGLLAASPYATGVFALDDGTVLDANPMALRAAGMAREELVGRLIRDLPFWDPATADRLANQVREHGYVRNMEITTRRAPGGPRPALVSAQAVELDGRQCFVAVMNDIAELRQAEAARTALDTELRNVFSVMRDIVLVINRDGEYLRIPTTEANQRFGLSESLAGKFVYDLLEPGDADAICAATRQSLDERRTMSMEHMLRIDGRELWLSSVVTPLTDDSVVWVSRDVTEERQTRQALADSEAEYRHLFDQNPQPMFVVDQATLAFLDSNEVAIRHYGYSREEFLSMTPMDIRLYEDVASVLAVEAAPWPLDDRRTVRHRKRNGEPIDVDIKRDSIMYRGRSAWLVLASDVTERLLVSRELERSLSLQRATLEATADGILALDLGGRITSWNGKFAELWNLPAGTTDVSVVERAFASALSQTKDPAASAAARAKALAANPDDTYFEMLEFAHGRIVERYSQPRRHGDEVVGRVSSFRDVTERERSAAQRKVLTDRLESAFADAPLGMNIVSPTGRWIQVNKAMCELLGRSPQHLLGEATESMTHPEDVARTRAAFEALLSGKERRIHFEKRYLHSSGRVVWALVSATILDTGESSGLIISQVLDVTEQHAAEEAVKRQALVFETVSEAIVLCSADRRIVDVNPAATAIFGYERDELVGQTPQLWQRAEASLPVYRAMQAELDRAGVWSGEYAFVAKDGHIGMAEVTIQVLRDVDGKIISKIAVIRDVTERRLMDRHLLESQKLEAIGSLAAGIAHEINTPMQYVGDNVRFLGDSIDAFGRVVREARKLADVARVHAGLADAVAAFDRTASDVDMDYLMGEMPVAAAHSREGCDRVSEIVRAMKDFSHPGGTEKQFVDLNAAVRNTITVCRNEWKYVAELAMDLDATMPFVPCLPGELQQVVLNLVMNAAHAVGEAREGSGELGHIAVSTRHDGDWAEIRVRDDGCGIPEAIRGKVFDPFFTTKKVGFGTGQGLSISHATVAQKHQGTLTFESTEGRGTTFIIRLPLDGGATVSEAA